MRRALSIVAGVAFVIAALIGAAMVWIAFQENLHGETFDQTSGAIHYGYVIALFGSWFLTVFVLVVVSGGIVYVLGRMIRNWKTR